MTNESGSPCAPAGVREIVPPEDATILVCCGDTAGHLFMAAAVADIIKEHWPWREIVFVGARGRVPIEDLLGPEGKIHLLRISPFERNNLAANVLLPWKMGLSMVQSFQLLKKYRPALVIGLGGYPSGPLLVTAALRRVPSLIIEPNYVPGLTNTLLKSGVDRICVSFLDTMRRFPERKTVCTGTPIRKSILSTSVRREEACARLQLSPNLKTLLIVGGSLGSDSLNRMVLKSMTPLSEEQDLQFLWQTGDQYFERIQNAVAQRGIGRCRVVPFIEHMAEAYRAADLVVSAAGAVTLAELACLGKPMIVIPSQEVTANHQFMNARYYAAKGACVMISSRDTGCVLAARTMEMLHSERELKRLAERAKAAAHPFANTRIGTEIEKLLWNRRRALTNFLET